MDMSDKYSTWVEIDLGAIEGNVRFVRDLTGVEVMAIVKADAYGHGVLPIAQAALRGGATWCGVARIGEALELRQAGLDCPILLLGYTPIERMGEAINQGISMTLWDFSQVEAASAQAVKSGEPALLHLKVDTGMGRLGVLPKDAFALVKRISTTPGVILEGLFTHFARADELDKKPTGRQENIFRRLITELEAANLLPPKVHAANSAVSLSRPSAHFNLVRLGIAMYGLHPSPECPAPKEMRPVLTWKSVLSQVKTLPTGSGVSYGHEYITQGNERIGTIPVGYADGFRRTQGNYVLVAGQRVPVIGRVCMDQIMVQLDEVPQAQAGDTVILIGKQGQDWITAEDVARTWKTINYEVVCAIGRRVPRINIQV
jgi:alanine racemase